jgi:hypothetical protein
MDAVTSLLRTFRTSGCSGGAAAPFPNSLLKKPWPSLMTATALLASCLEENSIASTEQTQSHPPN